MSVSPDSPASSSLGESPGSAVFGMAELVGMIISNWTQPELARVARVNSVAASECRRVLYQSPWLDNITGSDQQMNRLARSLKKWPGHFKDLGLGFAHDGAPDQDQLCRLFVACAPLVSLELAGLSSCSSGLVLNVLYPFAEQLVNLTLDFVEPPHNDRDASLPLLWGCTSLKHLALEDFDAGDRYVSVRPAPTYQLETLIIRCPSGRHIDRQALAWLTGASRATLKSVTLGDLGPDATAALTTLAPELEEAVFEVAAGEELAAAMEVADQTTIRRVVVRPRNWYSFATSDRRHAEWWLARSLDGLVPESRAKVETEWVDWE